MRRTGTTQKNCDRRPVEKKAVTFVATRTGTSSASSGCSRNILAISGGKKSKAKLLSPNGGETLYKKKISRKKEKKPILAQAVSEEHWHRDGFHFRGTLRHGTDGEQKKAETRGRSTRDNEDRDSRRKNQDAVTYGLGFWERKASGQGGPLGVRDRHDRGSM